MIKKFQNDAAYIAAGKPTTESRVALIEESNEVKIDGINVMVKNPTTGDAVYHDGTKYCFFKGGDQINHSLLTSNGYTLVGVVEGWIGDKVLVSNKAASNRQWLAAWQYAITAISSTNITIRLTMEGDYDHYKDIAITLTSTEINQTTADEITAALEASGNDGNVGYANHGYWAFLEEDYDGQGHNRIIVQCDFDGSYQQYQVAGTGCTIALSVWGDMPANSALWRKNGVSTYWGGMNKARFVTYYSTNGKTPTANYAVNSTDPIKRACFEDSTNEGYQYCAAIREAFATYEDYMESLMVTYPQKYGVFSMADGKTLCDKYWNVKFTKKDGTELPLYPALHYGHNVTTYDGINGISLGDWFLPGVKEGMLMMNDDIIDVVRTTAAKVGATQINNSTHRCFAQRYNAGGVWYFNGNSGHLLHNNVYNSYSVQAVTLLKP